MNCKAQQYSDQMVCKECDLMWDMNEQSPPYCSTKKDNKKIKFIRYINGLGALVDIVAEKYKPSSQHTIVLEYEISIPKRD